MKRILLVTVIIITTVFSLFAQNTSEKMSYKGFIKGGTGYYLNDFPEPFYGQTMWFEGGYVLPNNLIVTVGIMYAKTKNYNYTGGDDGISVSKERLEFYQSYSVNIGYEFIITGNHRFTPGVGLVYNDWSSSYAYMYKGITSCNLDAGVYQDPELGINLNLDYSYEFKSKLFVGARLNGLYLISIGFESLYLSPIIGVKF